MPTYTFKLNGKEVTTTAPADMPLLWVLRDRLGITGPKYGCGVGVCRACTSHINGQAAQICTVNISDVAKRRIGDDAAGFTMLLELLAEHGATSDGQQATPIAIETASGLLPAALLASGFTVYAINPLAVSRYRDRYAVSRAKSNAGDAFVLANVLRTDRNAHRPVPNDSELVRAIRVLARAQQDAVWDRQQAQNKLRSLLREYYPSALTTFTDLAAPAARKALLLSPTPAHAARLRAIDVARPLCVRVDGRCGIDADAVSVGDRGQTPVAGPQLGSSGSAGSRRAAARRRIRYRARTAAGRR